MNEASGARRLTGLLIAGSLTLVAASAALEVPYLAGRVNDLADLLSAQTEVAIEARLAQLEETTGAQVAVLTLASLEGEVLEDYSLRVAETWQLGRGQFDDGALLLIARQERQMRLEVGYGLEGTIPDVLAKRVLDDVLRPRFREGDFDGGVTAAVEVIAALIQGDDALPPPGSGGSAQPSSRGSGWIAFLFFLIPIGLFSLQALSSRGCLGWFLYLFLMPFWYLFPLAMLGRPLGFVPFGLWLVGFPLLWAILHRTPSGRGWRDAGWGPFFGPGRGGGGWSSSRGGFGGGFSGGGGSFGGGGASGGW